MSERPDGRGTVLRDLYIDGRVYRVRPEVLAHVRFLSDLISSLGQRAAEMAMENLAARNDPPPRPHPGRAISYYDDPVGFIMRRIVIDEITGCWHWLGTIELGGYGATNVAGQSKTAHRLAYETIIGPIPPRLVLDHLCRMRGCVNPYHLEPITHGENTRRGLVCVNSAAGMCKRGHPRTDENNCGTAEHWLCRQFKLDRAAAKRQKRREARAAYSQPPFGKRERAA